MKSLLSRYPWIVLGWQLAVIAIFIPAVLQGADYEYKFLHNDAIPHYVRLTLGVISVVFPSIAAGVSARREGKDVIDAFEATCTTLLFIALVNLPLLFVTSVIATAGF